MAYPMTRLTASLQPDPTIRVHGTLFELQPIVAVDRIERIFDEMSDRLEDSCVNVARVACANKDKVKARLNDLTSVATFGCDEA